MVLEMHIQGARHNVAVTVPPCCARMWAMRSSPLQTLTAATSNLYRVFWLRNVMAAVLMLAAAAASSWYRIELPLTSLAAAIMLMLSLNAFTWWRLGYPNPVGSVELLTQLLLDIAILSLLFYATGGYSNPFVWMYLLPITVASVALPIRLTWLVAGLAVASYSGLMFWFEPLPMAPMGVAGVEDMHMQHMHHESGFSIHLLGMWAGFVVSAAVIAFFVSHMASTLREYDHRLAEAREKALESERMLALGALATGAAHELGTPLATMAVLTRELQQDYPQDPHLRESLTLLRSQVDRCKSILSSLAASAGQVRAEDSAGQPLDRFLQDTLDHWRNTRPAIVFRAELLGTSPAPLVVIDRTLGQALVNLLDNAADAANREVHLSGRWTADELLLDIRDDGEGLTQAIAGQAGTPFFTTKAEAGMGLGLYLARMIFGRFGGTVTLDNHHEGGALTHVRLPLAGLRSGASA